jgi:hypothetical protein
MIRAREAGRRVVFVDECLFCWNTIATTAFIEKRRNVTFDKGLAQTKRLTLIMAVSAEDGVVAFTHTQENVNSEIYVELLRLVAERIPRTAVLVDNISFHRSIKTIGEMGKLDIYPLYNFSYTPDLNAIERVFS